MEREIVAGRLRKLKTNEDGREFGGSQAISHFKVPRSRSELDPPDPQRAATAAKQSEE